MDMRQDQVDDCKECFTLFDKDGDGKIASQELGTVVRSLGLNPTEAEVQELIKQFIRNNSFAINDLVQVVGKLRREPRNSEEEIRDAFKVFDRDGSGFVSAAELRHIMTNMGEKLTDKELDEMISEIEVGGDGQINYEEMVRMMAVKR